MVKQPRCGYHKKGINDQKKEVVIKTIWTKAPRFCQSGSNQASRIDESGPNQVRRFDAGNI